MTENLFASSEGLDASKPVAGSDLFAPTPSADAPGPMAQGWRAGVQGVKAAGGGALALAGRGFGFQSLEDYGLKVAADANQKAAQYQRRVEDIGSLGDAADFGKYAIGTALPSILVTLAGAALGRGMGAAVGRNIAEETTKRFVASAGMAAGAGGAAVGLEAGTIFPEAVEQGVDSPVSRSVVGGIAAGALDILPEVYVARRLGLLGGTAVTGAASRGFAGAARDVAAQAGKTAVLEAGTEAAQTGVERLAAGQDLSSPEAISDYVNAAAVGAVAGAGFGGAAGAANAFRSPPPVEPPVAPAAPTAPVVEPPPPFSPYEPTPDISGKNPFFSGAVPERAVVDTDPAAPGVTPDARVAEADADLAANPAAVTYDFLNKQRAEIGATVQALTAELANKGRKRKLSVVKNELAAAQEKLVLTEGAIGKLGSTLETQADMAAPTVETTGDLPTPAAKSAPAPRAPDAPVADMQLAVAKLKRENGLLVSSDEATILRNSDKVEAAKAPPAARVVMPEPTSTRSSQKVGTPQQKAEAVLDVAHRSVEQRVTALAEGGVLKKDRVPGAVSEIRDAIEGALNSKLDVPAAKKQIAEDIAKIFKGKVNKADVGVFTDSLFAEAEDAQATYLSKAATAIEEHPGTPLVTRERLDSEVRYYGYDDGRSKGALVYMHPREFLSLAAEGGDVAKRAERGFDPAVFQKEFLPYLDVDGDGRVTSHEGRARAMAALNQGMESMPVVLSRRDPYESGKDVPKALRSERRAMTDVTIPVHGARLLNAKTFPNVLESRAGAFGELRASYETKAQEITDYLSFILGTPRDLEIRVYEQNVPDGPAGKYRYGAVKDVIEVALNAKMPLSVAAHEGFHRVEMRHLNGEEKSILRRGFDPRGARFKRLLEQARAYDAANNTHIADEILTKPVEARAYGFEFWKRGEMEVDGPLAKVFEKLRALFERIANFVQGLGFTSTEDIFAAIDMGKYAQGRSAIREIERGELNSVAGTVDLQSKASLYDLINRAKNGEVERTQLMAETAQALDKSDLPRPTFKDMFGIERDTISGSLSRWYLENISSGLNRARHSRGFKNVFDVLTAFNQRKNRLIADGVDSKLSRWRTAAGADITAAGRALLDRTSGGFAVGSAEYTAIRERLTEEQRKMFDQATEMVADRLRLEFEADQRTMNQLLGAGTPEYAEWLEKRTRQVETLITEGYVPERRYGDHVVHVSLPGADGKPITLMYEQYESQTEAQLRLKQYQQVLASTAPELTVAYGYRYRAERDASLSYQQFLDMARRQGIDLSQAERERLAKAMISADSVRRGRIFRRKNVPGYSEDAMRVLSEFAVTMANKVAYSEFGGALNDALNGQEVVVSVAGDRPVAQPGAEANVWAADGPESGFYRNLADKTVDFVMNPQSGGEWSRTARMAASLHFLGGSLAAGMVQLSSLPMNSVPWLYKSTTYSNAFAKVVAAAKATTANFGVMHDLAKLEDRNNRIEAVDSVPGLRDALVRAAQDGTTLDTEIYQIMGLTRGGILQKSRGVQKAVEGWMAPFRWTEQINRISTFIAAYRVGQENKLGGTELYEFAKEAVANTQGRYDEANRPSLARDPIWAVLFTFKSYPIFMSELMVALYKEKPAAATAMLASLAVAAGVNGMPFSEDIADLIDTIAQRIFGSAFNTKRALRNLAKTASEAVVGVDLSGVFMNGLVNELTGLSFASRVGMGNLIPGTRLGAADNDYSRTAQEMLGPVAGLVSGVVGGGKSLLKGDFSNAIKEAAPLAVKNALKGAQQWSDGYASDPAGRKVVDVSGVEALWQSIGFSSNSLSKAYEMDRMEKQTMAFYNEMRRDFMKDIVKAVRDGDKARIADAISAVTDWNAANPDMPMAMDAASVRRSVAEAGMPLSERTFVNLPRGLRAQALEGSR